MADGSLIEWTDATWNPVTGCSVVSPGCTNCYAMKLAGTRLQHHPSRRGLTVDSKAGPVWNGKVRRNGIWLDQPLRWRRPRRIFVCAHGDLFHDSVPDVWIDEVFATMALAWWHQFQVLTKRSARMREYLNDPTLPERLARWALRIHDKRSPERIDPATHYNDLGPADWRDPVSATLQLVDQRGGGNQVRAFDYGHGDAVVGPWPIPNVWLGVSAEDQPRLDERAADLVRTPAAVRFISAEPIVGPMDGRRWLPSGRKAIAAGTGEPFVAPHYYLMICEHCGWLGSSELAYDSWNYDDADVICPGCERSTLAEELPGIDWLVAGGESGAGARPMHPEWARQLRDQCVAAGVAFFFKQWGAWREFAHGTPDEEVEVESDAAEAIAAEAISPGWLTRDGRLFRDPMAIPEETPARLMEHVGKGKAGRILDGRTWSEFPGVRS